MLKQSSYIHYLESIVLSLLEIPRPTRDIPINDVTNVSMHGFSCSPYNIHEQIAKQRAARNAPQES